MKQSHSQSLQKLIYNEDIYIADAKYLDKSLGRGLFARRKIKKGEILFLIKGKIIPLTISSSSDSATLPNAIGVDDGVWINPHPNNALHFLNHSCDPNVGIKGRVTIVALKNIDKDEQVTIDYSITEGDKLWTLPSRCKCGSKNCRVKIKSIQFLPRSIYRSYLPFVPMFLQKLYLREHKT